MDSSQQGEPLWDAGEEGRVTLPGSLACTPPRGHLGYKGIRRAGGGKKKGDGEAQQDETLWDADKEGKVTLRGSLACVPPTGHRGYKGIGRVWGEKKEKRWEGAAGRDAVGC